MVKVAAWGGSVAQSLTCSACDSPWWCTSTSTARPSRTLPISEQHWRVGVWWSAMDLDLTARRRARLLANGSDRLDSIRSASASGDKPAPTPALPIPSPVSEAKSPPRKRLLEGRCFVRCADCHSAFSGSPVFSSSPPPGFGLGHSRSQLSQSTSAPTTVRSPRPRSPALSATCRAAALRCLPLQLCHRQWRRQR